jgi:hypothetical protein
VTDNTSYTRELVRAAGGGLRDCGLMAAAVAGFAVPWMFFEWLASWQTRRWHAEFAERLYQNAKQPEPPEPAPADRRRWRHGG